MFMNYGINDKIHLHAAFIAQKDQNYHFEF